MNTLEALLNSLVVKGEIDWEVCLVLADWHEDNGNDALARAWRQIERVRPKMYKGSQEKAWIVNEASKVFIRRPTYTAIPGIIKTVGKLPRVVIKKNAHRTGLVKLALAMSVVDLQFKVVEAVQYEWKMEWGT